MAFWKMEENLRNAQQSGYKAETTAHEPKSPFLESPGNFSGPESHGKISELTITELFYSQLQ